MKKKFLILIFFMIILAGNSFSQTTVSGTVIDSRTQEPIAFANVYFNGTYKGTTTNFEGQYEITTYYPSDTLTVKFMGYHLMSKKINKNQKQKLDFVLEPSVFQFEEITIVPGENKAHIILKKVWKNKKDHDLYKCDAFEMQKYDITQVYLRKFSENLPFYKNINLYSDVYDKFAIEVGDSNLPALPAYMTESVSDVYYNKLPKREKTIIKAKKISGLGYTQTNMILQLSQNIQSYNFNENSVKIIDKNFISPISRSGLLYYKYYLIDSSYIDGKYCFEIRVVPKREEDLAFKGTIWINDSTFALKRISVEVGKGANLNFVKRIQIQQDLAPTTDGVWIPSNTRFLADAVNIFVSTSSSCSNIIINQPKPVSFYTPSLEILEENKNEDLIIRQNRENKFTNLDTLTVNRLDSISKIPKIRLTSKLIEASIRGYYNLDKVELGPILLFHKQNNVEGHRFRVGFRTNSLWSKKWLLSGYSAYGTRDKKLKYNFQAERIISHQKRTKTGIQYKKDLENMGAIDEFYSNNSFLTYASSSGGSDKINQIKLFRFWIESNVIKGLSQKVVYTNKQLSPLSENYFFEYYYDDLKTFSRSDIYTSEFTFSTIYQPKANFIMDGNQWFPLYYKPSSIWTFNYTIGLRGFLGGNFDYKKISLSLKRRYDLGGFGYFIHNLKASKVLTPLPYPLLIVYPGNETIFRTNNTYNLLRYGEFISDKAFEIFYEYHPDGFFLNKLPLIKKLEWRAVTTGQFIFGGFNEKKNGYYDPIINPNGILPYTDSQGNNLTGFNILKPIKPYTEISYGIENIFKFLRVDAIHRLTYVNYEENIPEFGIKISGVFKL